MFVNLLNLLILFSDKDLANTYQIKSGPLNCKSGMVVYLIQCKTCKLQYVGSAITPFCKRFYNYKSHNKLYNSKGSAPQASFHANFNLPDHNSKEDWEFILIDQVESEESVRHKEALWQYKFNTFIPSGLNEREVTLDFG